jgi:membrane associated rhomboid family serine protease
MLPVGDDDTPSTTVPVVNLVIIAINVLVFLYQLVSPDFTNGFSTVPAEITTGKDLIGQFPIQLPDGTSAVVDEARGPTPLWLTLFSSMFMHGGWAHIGGNMLFLFIFGDNVEKAFGHLKYLAFYLVCGLVASLAQVYSGPDSIIPSLGASGAIAGVLAGYLVLFPSNRIKVLVASNVTTVPAIAMIGLWALIQFANGFGATSVSAETGGVAYMAHIGGFIAGLLLAFALRPFADRSVGQRTVGYPTRGTVG